MPHIAAGLGTAHIVSSNSTVALRILAMIRTDLNNISGNVSKTPS
jgi:hypothetical protein